MPEPWLASLHDSTLSDDFEQMALGRGASGAVVQGKEVDGDASQFLLSGDHSPYQVLKVDRFHGRTSSSNRARSSMSIDRAS
jgi:hypothetical protein